MNEEILEALKDMIRLVRGDDGTIYQTQNPYTRPAMVRALKAISATQGEENYFNADIPILEKTEEQKS